MKKVITYGTYDLLHYGHIRLLERAKALGDYLIVGVTGDDFDKARGKINVSQSLYERMNAVKATGLADEVIVEEFEGQKIEDIRKYGVDIFAIGSDWAGKFDYLKEYCEVVYLDRTEGVSSSELRSRENTLRMGLAGNSSNVDKVRREASFVDGLIAEEECREDSAEKYTEMLSSVDAVYIYAHPSKHYEMIKEALLSGKHVLCETPLTLKKDELDELFRLAEERGLVLMEALKTAFSTAYTRLILMLKSGKIGDIVSVDAVCTSMEEIAGVSREELENRWGSLADWGPTALLPVFQLLGTNWEEMRLISRRSEASERFDTFTKADFVYPKAVASVKVGKDVKSEGELIISGTKGYVYVPAPWWKTDFFEVRYEDQSRNQRYFYQLEGEGIRNELAAFLQACRTHHHVPCIEREVSEGIVRVMEDHQAGKGVLNLER